MNRLASRSAVTGTLIVVLTAVLLLVSPHLASGSSKLVWGGSSEAEGWHDTGVGQEITYGGLDPCVNKGSVTVTNIAFTTGNNLVVTGWGSRPNPFEHGGHQLGGEKVTLVQAGFQTGSRKLANLCSARDNGTEETIKNDYEFAIQFRRPAAATGWSYGLTVTYRSGGKTHHTRWPISYVMCGNTTPSYPSTTMAELCSG